MARLREAPWTILYFGQGGYSLPIGVLTGPGVVAIALAVQVLRPTRQYMARFFWDSPVRSPYS